MAAAPPPRKELTAEGAEMLDNYITEQLVGRRAAGEVISPAEEAKIRQDARAAIEDGTAEKMIAAPEDKEAAAEFTKMNFTLGLPGALAMYESLIRGCGLPPQRVGELIERIKIPFDFPRDSIGTIQIALPAAGGRKLLLRGGPCREGHNLTQQLAKLGNLSKENRERVNNQCSWIVNFTRRAYVAICNHNPDTSTELAAALDGWKISEGIDLTNTTIYLQKTPPEGGEPVPLEPRAGLFLVDA